VKSSWPKIQQPANKVNRPAPLSYFLLILATISCQFIASTQGELVSSAVPDASDPPVASPILRPSTTPRPTPIPDTGWIQLYPGLERRVINLLLESGQILEHIYLLRVDSSLYLFDVAYRPGRPQSLQQWLIEEGALAVVNGGFFTEAFEATGLTIVDGQHNGTTFEGFGGMLSITADGPRLRWLRQQPFDPSELPLAGLQSFPILVNPFEQGGYSDDSVMRARRTAIGQDASGRILLVVASSGTFTLADMSDFLLTSDLDLAVALNLDGGASSGLLLREPSEGIPAFTLLPTVITIHPKLTPD
jgi:hypothetical protein